MQGKSGLQRIEHADRGFSSRIVLLIDFSILATVPWPFPSEQNDQRSIFMHQQSSGVKVTMPLHCALRLPRDLFLI